MHETYLEAAQEELKLLRQHQLSRPCSCSNGREA